MAHSSTQETSIHRLFGYAPTDCPCRGCEKRVVGCHSGCEDYAHYRLVLKRNRNFVNIKRKEREHEYVPYPET